MSFLTPLALISALVIGPLIVAMYLLRLRREERQVSSTFLWRRAVRDVEANVPWQRLRRSWLLLLQLLLLLLLALAVARPFFFTPGITGRNLVIIVDRSASMSASDVEPTRLDAARNVALNLIDQLPDGGRATLIAAGGQMEVLAASSTDRRQLRDAVNAIAPYNGGGSDLAQALALAAALSSREAESEVAIISDGNVEIPTDLKMPATVRYFPIGQRDQNVAVSAMALQRSPGGQVLFAEVTNYGTSAARRRMDIYLDGTLFNAYDLALDPGADPDKPPVARSVIVEVPATTRVAEARLAPVPDDTLALDDRAWAVSDLGTETRVRVVSPGNRFLDTALALLPGIRAEILPATTSIFTETAVQVPVTILDGVVPENLPPGNLLFIAPVRSTSLFSVTGQVDFPALRPIPGDEPLLRNTSISQVSVLKANRIQPGAWARVVVDGDGGPMLLAGEKDGRRIVILSFDIHNSDLPLQVAFPLLISNMLSYLAPGSGGEAAQIAPGQPLAIPADPSISEVRVTRPDGKIVLAQIQGGQALYADTEMPGPYTVEQLQDTRVIARQMFAVNLFAPRESRISPQPELNIAQVSGLQQAVTREQVGRQEFWRWLAAVALAVLMIEWLVYQRNGLVYVRERLRQRMASKMHG